MTKKTIFIIEDEGIVAKDIQYQLISLGYDAPEIAATGEVALERLRIVHADLVLTDIMLQGTMDGIDTAMRIRSQWNIPVVYLTAFSDDATLERAKITEPFGYILKPFEDRELNIVIEMALYKHKMESKLQEREQRLATTLSSIGDSVICINPQEKITFLNSTAEKMTGWMLQEALGKNVEEVFPVISEDRETPIENPIKKALKSKNTESLINHTLLITKNKEKIPILNTAAPIKDDRGKILGCVMISRDDRERRGVEEEMKIINAFPRDNPNPVLRISRESTILYVNNAGIPLLNFWRKKLGEKLPSSWNAVVNDVFSQENGAMFQEKIGENTYQFSIMPFLDINSAYIYGQDITRRKEAEKNFAAEKQLLSVTLSSIEDGVITMDKTGRILFINKVAECLTGWIKEDAYGKNISEIFVIRKDNSTEKQQLSQLCLLAKKQKIVELDNTILLSHNRKKHLISGSIIALSDECYKEAKAVITFRDITEKTRMHDELTRARKLESLGILAGGIAHDFNNILTGILGNISLVKMSLGKENHLVKSLLEAEKSSWRARDLTQQLLTFAKGGAPIKVVTSIRNLVIEATTFALRESKAKCDFVSFPDNLLSVEVDIGQINQVINNLVINADQAMPEGGMIKIGLRNIGTGSMKSLYLTKGKYIEIQIADQGIGISHKLLAKIFDPYFTTKQTGSGLGLAICHSIIKRHGGKIIVDSKVGKGTIFSLYLPAISGQQSVEPEYDNDIQTGMEKILIMDDEDIVRRTMVMMLEKIGYRVECVDNGKKAIKTYQESVDSGKPFDIIILDLTIPGGIGGKEIIKLLQEKHPHVKAIVSSGYSNDPVMSNYQKNGFSARIFKPFSMNELAEAVKESLTT